MIVAYNSRDTLRACVEPLASRPWVKVTVVNNASPDDSAAAVADLPIRTISRFPRLRSTYCHAVGPHHLAPGASWAGEVISDPGAVLMRRRTLEEAGGLDEGFFLHSEETDLFRRLRGRGCRARFEPQAIAHHQCNGSAPRHSTAPILARSRVRYGRKHHGALVSLLKAVGVAIDAVIRAAAWAHRPARRRGHLASARAALSAVRLSTGAR